MFANRTANVLFILIATVFILIVTKRYLIPLILAVIIWFLIRELRFFLRKSSFIKQRLPVWLQNILVFGLIFLVLGFTTKLVSNSIRKFSKVIPQYQANIQQIYRQIEDMTGYGVINWLGDYSKEIDVSQAIQPIFNSLTSILGDGFIIIIYCAFLLLEEATFPKKLKLMFKDQRSYEQFIELLETVDTSFGSYFAIKTLMSVLTGVLSYIVLSLLGIDSPVLWAFIIFLLNYIPSIGSLIATSFPIIIAILQFGDLLPGLWVLVGVGSIQILVGNIIEPRVMGNSLNISPLVVIISLFSWGAIWGILGMILSVPIMVMLIFIFAQFPSTRGVAVMLSRDGELHNI